MALRKVTLDDGKIALEDTLTGEIYCGGLNVTERNGELYGSAPHYGGEVMPRSTWKEVDDTDMLPARLDQAKSEACGGFSLAGACAGMYKLMGVDIDFHGGWLYSFCNGGQDKGSNPDNCVQAANEKGLLPLNAGPQGAIYQNQFPKDAAAKAAVYRLKAVRRIHTFDECVTAVMEGAYVYFGTFIGEDFEPDAEGFLPQWRGKVYGHAMFLFRKLLNRKGQWWIGMCNSWGLRWGLRGTAMMPESYLSPSNMGKMFIAYRLEIVALPTNTADAQKPPLAMAA